MAKRFVAIWFRYLKTDWYTRRIPALGKTAFALSLPDRGRMVVTSINAIAHQRGIYEGMPVADARAIFPALHVLDDKPGHADSILKGLADWCIRYTPCVAVDMPEGLVLDATGCAHLWGDEKAYLTDISTRLPNLGYHVRVSMAGTIGAAWALSRFGETLAIVEPGQEHAAMSALPSAGLRLEPATLERLHKLGLRQVGNFMDMPHSALRRRFGGELLKRLNQALGMEDEPMQPVVPVEDYQVRLPCMEPILTRTGIEIALQTLLENLCARLKAEGKGLRKAFFKSFRVDGKIISVDIGTSRATAHVPHLFKLFETKLDTIEPALGIELFLLEAQQAEDVPTVQKNLWKKNAGLQNTAVFELLDRLGGKFGMDKLHRYLPDEHYWPERSIKPATSLSEPMTADWKVERPRPQQLLANPEPIQVTAPIPDYPPMLFRYKGKLHTIKKADGPERIEQEWWLQNGQHRDYYIVEDEEGNRYWLFRLGHYDADKTPGWFLHGFFA